MIQISEYDQIDPLEALNLNLLSRGRAFTPEQAARLRAADPRVMPCLALYALEHRKVVGQIGLLRLPLISAAGREDVGGLGAMAVLPQAGWENSLSALLDEAHRRQRAEGLRFSVLAARLDHPNYAVFREHGYADLGSWGSALARWETTRQPTRYHAQPPGEAGAGRVEAVFAAIAGDYLGFAWRPTPFAPLRELIYTEDILILWSNQQPVGYALTSLDDSLLRITNLTIRMDVDFAEAVAAITAQIKSSFVHVTFTRPVEAASLERRGYRVTRSGFETFMLKTLEPELGPADVRRLYGMGGDRFLISWLDLTWATG